MKDINIKPYQTDDMYLHKLINYKDLFIILFDQINFDSVCEIGIETGEFTTFLHDYIEAKVINKYFGVDVSIPFRFEINSYYYEMTSLEYLSSIEHSGHDLYILDGDHNYYTVFKELNYIFSSTHGKKVCVLHDTNWPCGRRDFYYNPSLIPVDEIKQITWEKKLIRCSSEMQSFGFYGNGAFAISAEEGTSKNGITCAIEDFISKKEGFKVISFPQFLGLTILYDENNLSLDEKLVFSELSKLIEHNFIYNSLCQLEYNRLDIYTKLLSTYQQHELELESLKKELTNSSQELDYYTRNHSTIIKSLRTNLKRLFHKLVLFGKSGSKEP